MGRCRKVDAVSLFTRMDSWLSNRRNGPSATACTLGSRRGLQIYRSCNICGRQKWTACSIKDKEGEGRTHKNACCREVRTALTEIGANDELPMKTRRNAGTQLVMDVIDSLLDKTSRIQTSATVITDNTTKVNVQLYNRVHAMRFFSIGVCSRMSSLTSEFSPSRAFSRLSFSHAGCSLAFSLCSSLEKAVGLPHALFAFL